MKLLSFFFLALSSCALLPAQIVLLPGDLNNDGTANHIDLLALGLAYGQEGPPRELAFPEWLPQEGPFWPQQLPFSGVNYGFIDANGDGFIDSLDVELIPYNYDSTQMAAFPEPRPYFLPDTVFMDNPPQLNLRFDRDVAGPGDTVALIIEYVVPDPTAFPPDALPLGIAFSLGGLDAFPAASPIAIFPDTVPGDLLFVAATANLAQFWRSVPPGQLEFAAAGKGTGALGTSRQLAKMLIIIEDMIILYERPAIPDSVLLINTKEQVIALKTSGDTLTVGNRQPPVYAAFAKVFPNPARYGLTVQMEQPLRVQLSLFAPAGQALRQERHELASTLSISTKGLPPGLYILEIRTERGVQVEKVFIE